MLCKLFCSKQISLPPETMTITKGEGVQIMHETSQSPTNVATLNSYFA